MDTETLLLRVYVVLGREVQAHALRAMLRLLFPKDAPGKGGEWSLNTRQVRLVEDCFRLLRTYEEAELGER